MAMMGTTICAVKRAGKIAIAGDGQVTMGENTIFKNTARKVRRIYHDQVVTGFAGSVADAFSLCERFEERLNQCGGSLEITSRPGCTRATVRIPKKHESKGNEADGKT